MKPEKPSAASAASAPDAPVAYLERIRDYYARLGYGAPY
ncbi:MAG: hypothetical protein RL434_1221, partial [Pseudomonadota bacterium]